MYIYVYIYIYIYTVILYIWILMFWRGTFKRRFCEKRRRRRQIKISLGGNYFYEYIVVNMKLWYLELMIASKIQNSAAGVAEL